MFAMPFSLTVVAGVSSAVTLFFDSSSILRTNVHRETHENTIFCVLTEFKQLLKMPNVDQTTCRDTFNLQKASTAKNRLSTMQCSVLLFTNFISCRGGVKGTVSLVLIFTCACAVKPLLRSCFLSFAPFVPSFVLSSKS